MVRRLLPLSGIVFVVGVLVGIAGIGGNTPDIKSSATKITSFYGAHHSKQTLAVYVVFWATPFVIFFAASVAAALWSGGSIRENVWQLVLIGGSVVTAAGIHYALADGGNQHLPGTTMQALNALDADTYFVFVGGLGIMMLGAAGSMIRRTDAYRWFGWAALVVGIGIFTPVGFVAMLLSALWIILASLMGFRNRLLVAPALPQPA